MERAVTFAKIKSVVRKSALWALRSFGPGDISIRHHYTGDRIMLHAFKHKGYWFYGKRRERNTMRMLRKVVFEGETVLDVGAHIGYLSVYFAQLVGPGGRVFAFEPDPENRRYLRGNVERRPQVSIIEKAVAASTGERNFFVENLTGQNNTLYDDYPTLDSNSAAAGYSGGGYRKITVEAISIDDFCRNEHVHPDFVKFDIEGAELEALRGMEETVARSPPRLMVEVSLHQPEVVRWLTERGYYLYDDEGHRLFLQEHYVNVFCFHREAHYKLLTELGLDVTASNI
jgi:FkbM family methyltransferase